MSIDTLRPTHQYCGHHCRSHVRLPYAPLQSSGPMGEVISPDLAQWYIIVDQLSHCLFRNLQRGGRQHRARALSPPPQGSRCQLPSAPLKIITPVLAGEQMKRCLYQLSPQHIDRPSINPQHRYSLLLLIAVRDVLSEDLATGRPSSDRSSGSCSVFARSSVNP